MKHYMQKQFRNIKKWCFSDHHFAISSRLHLAVQSLGVALWFVDNYASRKLSPQTDGMFVILKNGKPTYVGFP